jgi:LPXTG-motif cell wall-anchored protein
MPYTYTLFAATYNCGSYGAGSYNTNGNTCTTGTSSAPGSSSGSGGLANTGQSILFPIAGGILLIAVAIALLIHTVRRKK